MIVFFSISEPEVNLALQKPASQSSVHTYETLCEDSLVATGAAGLSVDGIIKKDFSKQECYCSCTESEVNVKSWWQVDLLQLAKISRVVITYGNRAREFFLLY